MLIDVLPWNEQNLGVPAAVRFDLDQNGRRERNNFPTQSRIAIIIVINLEMRK
jgi:hypothetical protein